MSTVWRCDWCGWWNIGHPSRCTSCWVLEGIKRGGLLTLVCLSFALGCPVEADQTKQVAGYASWYSRASCAKEGTSGIMANGRRVDDDAFTAASWGWSLGQRVTVCRADRSRCVQVEITDRGPARRLYRAGRVCDLSQAAFQALAPITQGVIQVSIEPVEDVWP